MKKMSNVVVLATNKQTLKPNRTRSTNNNDSSGTNINHHQSSNDSSKQTSIFLQEQRQRHQYNNDNNNSNCNSNLETNRLHSSCDNTAPESSYPSHTSSLVLSSSSSLSPPLLQSSSSSSSSSSSTSHPSSSSSSSSFSSFRERSKTSSSTTSSSSSTTSIVVRQTNKLQTISQQHCSCMLLNRNINPALEGASSGSSGPSTTASHNCLCSINQQPHQQQQQPQLHQNHHQKQHQQQQQQHQQLQHRPNVSPSYYNTTQPEHANEKYIKLDAQIGTSLNHTNPSLVKNTLCNSNNNSSAHYKAFKRSHRQLQLEQQQPHQATLITTNNHQAQNETHRGFQPQSSTSSLQLLELPLPAARNLLKRKNISEQGSGEGRNLTSVGTSSKLNDSTNEELGDDLNFDYEPVLTKILDEKKLALSNLPDVVKFLSDLQQQRQHRD